MRGADGLEPATSGVTGRRANHAIEHTSDDHRTFRVSFHLVTEFVTIATFTSKRSAPARDRASKRREVRGGRRRQSLLSARTRAKLSHSVHQNGMSVLFTYAALIRLQTVLPLTLLAYGIGMTLGDSHMRVAVAAIGIACALAGGYAYNDLRDQPRDRINRPARPLVSGRLSDSQVKRFVTLAFGGAVLAAAATASRLTIAFIVVLIGCLCPLLRRRQARRRPEKSVRRCVVRPSAMGRVARPCRRGDGSPGDGHRRSVRDAEGARGRRLRSRRRCRGRRPHDPGRPRTPSRPRRRPRPQPHVVARGPLRRNRPGHAGPRAGGEARRS